MQDSGIRTQCVFSPPHSILWCLCSCSGSAVTDLPGTQGVESSGRPGLGSQGRLPSPCSCRPACRGSPDCCLPCFPAGLAGLPGERGFGSVHGLHCSRNSMVTLCLAGAEMKPGVASSASQTLRVFLVRQLSFCGSSGKG